MNIKGDGISILICSHNGAKRIEQTLDFLSQQKFHKAIPWEVVLVDNASTDGLAQVASAFWKVDTPLRIIPEPRLGVTWARMTGIAACQYHYVGFVDDDNWVSTNWVETAYEIMDSNPDVGAVGSLSEAAFESSAAVPAWFEKLKGNYAVGAPQQNGGRLERPDGVLWGAGLVIRKEAWERLVDFGFQPILHSREGTSLMSGEETEILLLFKLSGWSLYYDPRLRIQHFIPAGRLKWPYYLRLRRGLGATAVYLNLYRALITIAAQRKPNPIVYKPWYLASIQTLFEMLKDPLAVLASLAGMNEGNYRIARIHFLSGMLVERIKRRQAVDRLYTGLLKQYIDEGYSPRLSRKG